MKPFPLLVGAPFLLLWAAPCLHAERADKEKPTTVESDQMFYDDLKQTNVFKGNVLLTRGTLVIKADTLSSRQDAEGYQTGTAVGNPAHLRQKSDSRPDANGAAKEPYTQASGSQIEYDDRTQRARVTGNAVLKRLDGSKVTEEVRGHVIVYDAGNETYTVEAGTGAVTPNNPQGRVRLVIQPKETGKEETTSPGERVKFTFKPVLKAATEIKNPRPE